MVNVVELINKINDIEARLPKMAFHFRLQFKLYPRSENDPDAERSIIGAINRLKQLIAESKDNQLQFTSMGQLQEFGMLNQIIEMASKFKSYDEVKKGAKSTEPEILFYKDLIKNYNYWLGRKKYIRIPNDVQYEAYQGIEKYEEMYRKMSKENKNNFAPTLLRMRANVKKNLRSFFDEKIAEKESKVRVLLNNWQKAQIDKGQYIENTYLYFPEMRDIFGLDNYIALAEILNWANTNEDPNYLFSADELRKDFFEFLHNAKETIEMRKQMQEQIDKEKELQAKKEREEAIRKAKDPEFMRNQRIAAINQEAEKVLQETGDEMQKIEEGAVQYASMMQNIDDPNLNLNMTQAQEMAKGIDNLEQQTQSLLDNARQIESKLN